MTTETTNQNDRLVRLFTWIIPNGAMVWCALVGVNGNIGAGRVLVLAAWFFAVVNCLVAITSKHVAAKITAKGRSVPAWISHGFDVAMIVFLVWHGWWFTGIAFILLTIAEADIYSE